MIKFLDTMGKIVRLEKRLQEQLASIQWFCENGSTYEVYLHSLNMEETAERLVLLTRALPAYTGVPNAKLEVERRIKDCIPVEIGLRRRAGFVSASRLCFQKSRAGRRIISALFYILLCGLFLKSSLLCGIGTVS